MLLTPHTLVGIAIASTIKEPSISIPVSIGMHFIGDLVPHWDFFSNTTSEQRTSGWRPIAVALELGVAVATGVFFVLLALWKLNNPALAVNIFLCGIAGVLPDILSGLSMYIGKENKLLKINDRTQSRMQVQLPLPWGILTQILVSILCVLIILNSAGLL